MSSTQAPAPSPPAQGQPQAQATTPSGETVDQTLERARLAAVAKRWNEAAGICQDVLAVKPDAPAAFALLGIIDAERGKTDSAIAWLEKAIAGAGHIGSWHSNLGLLYRRAYRIEDAIRAGVRSIELEPKNSGFYANLALALMDAHNYGAAKTQLLKAIGAQADNATAHLALGQILLTTADRTNEMQAGWLEYEWRNKLDMAKGTMPDMPSPQWNGMRLDGRLLVVADQGFGDSIQFARYLPLAAQRCKEVVLGCSPEMLPVLSKMPGIVSAHHQWNEVQNHVAHIRISSLPHLLQTEISTIPRTVPYLSAEPERVAAWGAHLNQTLGQGHFRVGIAWSGRPTHPNDYRRSLRLAQLRPLAAVPGVRFVALQKPFPDSDRADMTVFPGIADLSEQLRDFGETAALVANLDLVITIDSGVAHISGAMGHPVWVLLPRPNDWRWLLERADSPWYPSLRLFRQQSPGQWEPVIAAAAAALRERVAAKLGGALPPPNV